MMRYRWFQIGLKMELSSLVSRLKKRPLSEAASYGFIFTKASNGKYYFRFATKSSVPFTRVGEDGLSRTDVVSTVVFSEIELSAMNGKCLLRVDNPSRGMKALFNALETEAGFGFYVTPICIAPIKAKSIFGKNKNNKMIGAGIVGANPVEGLNFRLDVSSPEGLSLESMEMLKDVKYQINSVTYDVSHQGVAGRVSFSGSGLIKIEGKLSPMLLDRIEQEILLLV